ncbi:MAG TPA: adenylate/guanylate cyclase domain-containing protein [Candidatus Limnocylindrales bacterium]
MPQSNDEMWRNLLEGTDPDLTRLQRIFRRIPSAPRCKMCNAPFGRPGSLFLGPAGWRRWPANPSMCRICARGLDKVRGGAEIDATFLFADIRGSTGMAERAAPAEFQAVLQRFYDVCATAVDAGGGIVDKYLGDGVVALFTPLFAAEGDTPAGGAIRAGRAILAGTDHGAAGGPWLPVGVGVHAGLAFVGVLGTEGGALDFTGVGDTVNTAARLGSVAADGELLVSVAAAERANVGAADAEHRTLDLKGREQPIEVVVLHAADVGHASIPA